MILFKGLSNFEKGQEGFAMIPLKKSWLATTQLQPPKLFQSLQYWNIIQISFNTDVYMFLNEGTYCFTRFSIDEPGWGQRLPR